MSRHDSDLALSRLNNTRAVGADQACDILLYKSVLDQHHVSLWDAFGNTNYKLDTGVNGLVNGSSSKGRRHVDYGGLSSSGILGVLNRVEHRESQVGLASLSRGNTTNQVGSVVQGLLTVKGSLINVSGRDNIGTGLVMNEGGKDVG